MISYVLSTDRGEVYFEVLISNEAQWNLAVQSGMLMGKDPSDDQILKLRKLHYLAGEETIYKIFKNYSVLDNAVRFNLGKDGSNTGDCCVAFVSSQEAANAYSNLKDQILSSESIILERSSVQEFEEFSSSMAFSGISSCIYKYTNPDRVTKSLLVSHMPLNSTFEDATSLFHCFSFSKTKIIFDDLLIYNLGCFIIELGSEEDCDMAKNYISSKQFLIQKRHRKLKAENLLNVINKGKY